MKNKSKIKYMYTRSMISAVLFHAAHKLDVAMEITEEGEAVQVKQMDGETEWEKSNTGDEEQEQEKKNHASKIYTT